MDKKPDYFREETMPLSPGLELIAQERYRQVKEEGWSSKHDDEHTPNTLSNAGVCYALGSDSRQAIIPGGTFGGVDRARTLLECLWPWEVEAWKPGSPDKEGRLKELVKAGALIAAEIDRITRTRSQG